MSETEKVKVMVCGLPSIQKRDLREVHMSNVKLFNDTVTILDNLNFISNDTEQRILNFGYTIHVEKNKEIHDTMMLLFKGAKL